MQNSGWDKHLRDMLGDFRPGDDTPHWDEFERQLDARDTPSDPSEPISDDQLHDSLFRYEPEGEVKGWDRIESSLNAADHQFDNNVRKRIQHYEPGYDPMSWPIFLRKFTEHKLLRIKLVALKVVEFAAIILLLLTVVNMGRMGKLPFETPLFDSHKQESATLPGDRANAEEIEVNSEQLAVNRSQSSVSNEQLAGNSWAKLSPHLGDLGANKQLAGNSWAKLSPHLGDLGANKQLAGNSWAKLSPHLGDLGANKQLAVNSRVALSPPRLLSEVEVSGAVLSGSTRMRERQSKQDLGVPGTSEPPVGNNQHTTTLPLQSATLTVSSIEERPSDLPLRQPIETAYVTDFLAAATPTFEFNTGLLIPAVEHIAVRPGTFLEFSVLSQADYNRLRMPEDRLYSGGKQIVFPVQGIPSHGFGAGFTMAIGHPVWALESGIIYSSKDFKPGRRMIVGGAFDNGSVEFESMSLQMISVPVQYRYRFDRQGRLKAYALAGFSAHVIAQSDIDIVIKYHFPSLAAGANPNNDPYFAQTIRETRRISQHIRDGAPFSSKSFFSLNAGTGLEYSLTPHKTLFLQTVLQYQVPNLKFSNNDGKHIRSLSLQAGVRTPLGE